MLHYPVSGNPSSICEAELDDAGMIPDNPGEGYQWIILPRYGRRPLAVMGRCMFRADNHFDKNALWSEIVIFETATSRCAAALRHITPRAEWQNAWLCSSPELMLADLKAHSPINVLSISVAGYDIQYLLTGQYAWTCFLTAIFIMPGQASCISR